MELHLDDKTAIVTGAGRGIGLATVRALIAEGVRVAGVSRTITTELKESGAIPVAADLATLGGVDQGIGEAINALGGVDLLVNNVGDAGTPAAFVDTADEAWLQAFDINFFSAVRVTRAVVPSIVERHGAIVDVSTLSARFPSSGPGPYSTSKAALTAFGKALSEELGPQGVRVNTVSPGPVLTGLWENPDSFGSKMAAVYGLEQQEFVDGIAKNFNVTLGHIAAPEEIAGLITFLLSELAGSITGADYLIDGGMNKNG